MSMYNAPRLSLFANLSIIVHAMYFSYSGSSQAPKWLYNRESVLIIHRLAPLCILRILTPHALHSLS